MFAIKNTLFFLFVTAALLCGSGPVLSLEITVNGLFNGGAVFVIDGKHRLMREGDRSPEGVVLVSVTKAEATFRYGEQVQSLGMNRTISTQFKKAEKSQTRIATGAGGHFFTPGRINGLAVDFLVDTGATSVAINLPTAKALGLNYRAGEQINMNTANGVASAYIVMLNSVRVGDVEVRNVEAVVSMGDFPAEILLGNSFLGRVEMRRENGVLVLESQF